MCGVDDELDERLRRLVDVVTELARAGQARRAGSADEGLQRSALQVDRRLRRDLGEVEDDVGALRRVQADRVCDGGSATATEFISPRPCRPVAGTRPPSSSSDRSASVLVQICIGSSSLPLRNRKRYGLLVTVRYGDSVPLTVHTARYGGLRLVRRADPVRLELCPASISAGTCWNMIGMSSHAVGCCGSAGTGRASASTAATARPSGRTTARTCSPLAVGSPRAASAAGPRRGRSRRAR